MLSVAGAVRRRVGCCCTRPDVKKFATLPYAPIVDASWKKQQRKAHVDPKLIDQKK
jgi:hypothetical protein